MTSIAFKTLAQMWDDTKHSKLHHQAHEICFTHGEVKKTLEDLILLSSCFVAANLKALSWWFGCAYQQHSNCNWPELLQQRIDWNLLLLMNLSLVWKINACRFFSLLCQLVLKLVHRLVPKLIHLLGSPSPFVRGANTSVASMAAVPLMVGELLSREQGPDHCDSRNNRQTQKSSS